MLNRSYELTKKFKENFRKSPSKNNLFLLSYKFFNRINLKYFAPFGIVIFLLFIISFYFLSHKQWLFMEGSDNMVLELIILLQFERFYGSLFLYNAVFTLFLMLGLYIGNYFAQKMDINKKIGSISKLLFLIIILISMGFIRSFVLFLLLNLLLGIFSGVEFYALSHISKDKFAILGDYLGSFLMSLLGGLLLLPIFGILCVLLFLLILRIVATIPLLTSSR